MGEARIMIQDPIALAQMQKQCERFVAELHDNQRNVDAFLAGLFAKA